MLSKDKIISTFYCNSAYKDYGLEDVALERKGILLKIQRKSNAKKIDTLEQKNQKLKVIKRVETTIGKIKKMFPTTLHSITLEVFLIKLILFIFGIQLNKSIN